MSGSVAVALRALRPEDAGTIARWGDDPEFCRLADWSRTETFVDRASRLRRLIEDPPADLLRLGVGQAGGGLVGYVDLHGSDPQWRELGYVIGGRSRCGQGLGLAAASAACVHGFHVLHLSQIRAEVTPDNTRSIAILRRLGMTEVTTSMASAHRRFTLARRQALGVPAP